MEKGQESMAMDGLYRSILKFHEEATPNFYRNICKILQNNLAQHI
jgi:hypothetical protein